MIFDGRNLHLTYAVFIFTDFQQNLFIYNRQIQHRQQKTSQWEVFLESACRLSVKGAFLLQNPLFFTPIFGLKNSPAKAP